jgi:hypothetical protein
MRDPTRECKEADCRAANISYLAFLLAPRRYASLVDPCRELGRVQQLPIDLCFFAQETVTVRRTQ